MKYAIVYDSLGGSTQLLARAVKEDMPSADCVCFSSMEKAAGLAQAELVLVGFWTDKGDCTPACAAFLEGLSEKKVALFGTAGFSGDAAYFEAILSRVQAHLPKEAAYLGGFMCTGKIDAALKARSESELEKDPENERAKVLLEAWKASQSHPDFEDIKGGIAFGKEMFKKED